MSRFAEHVTSTAFSLTLSRPMIECLSHLDQYDSTWVIQATFSALENRGLVQALSMPSDLPTEVTNQFCRRVVGLTEAGQAIIPLLKLAGLYVELPVRTPIIDVGKAEVKLKEEYKK